MSLAEIGTGHSFPILVAEFFQTPTQLTVSPAFRISPAWERPYTQSQHCVPTSCEDTHVDTQIMGVVQGASEWLQATS